jgi:hypothetical protein
VLFAAYFTLTLAFGFTSARLVSEGRLFEVGVLVWMTLMTVWFIVSDVNVDHMNDVNPHAVSWS